MNASSAATTATAAIAAAAAAMEVAGRDICNGIRKSVAGYKQWDARMCGIDAMGCGILYLGNRRATPKTFAPASIRAQREAQEKRAQ